MADLPTYAEVTALLKYEPETGKLWWLPRPRELFLKDSAWKTWNRRFSGKEALSCADKSGRKGGSINGIRRAAHRIAWLLHCGSWPTGDIDHIDGNPGNNCISNLRDVTHQINLTNRALSLNNTSGFAGVYKTRQGKWGARIRTKKDGLIHLGVFVEKSDAAKKRREACEAYGHIDRV